MITHATHKSLTGSETLAYLRQNKMIAGEEGQYYLFFWPDNCICLESFAYASGTCERTLMPDGKTVLEYFQFPDSENSLDVFHGDDTEWRAQYWPKEIDNLADLETFLNEKVAGTPRGFWSDVSHEDLLNGNFDRARFSVPAGPQSTENVETITLIYTGPTRK